MPYSAGENSAAVLDFVKSHKIQWVLDVGAGSGTYGRLIRDHVSAIDAVEIWTPYIEMFSLNDVYDYIHNKDARDISPELFNLYDLVIFGDVLEHMSEEDSLNLWARASGAKYEMLSVPIIHYPQGESFGNPYELHVQEHLTVAHVREKYGPFKEEYVYEVTGTFIRENVV